MSLACPKTRGTSFVRITKTYRYEPRAFLWWSWLAEVHDGYIVRCPDVGCSRIWRVDLNGVHVPAGHEAPKAQPEIEHRERDRERDESEPMPPLGLAVRRERV